MKNGNVRYWVIVIVVCLSISVGYMALNRTTSRDATAQEIEEHQAYAVDWSSVPGWEEGMTEKEFILNLCSYMQDKTIGSNVHKVYSSDVLPEYLHRCHEISEITVLDDTLYITYYAQDEDMVILAYNDEGIAEMAVYDADTDTLYHEIDGNVMVWNKFRKGFQWGK